MGILVSSLLWVMQDIYIYIYISSIVCKGFRKTVKRFRASELWGNSGNYRLDVFGSRPNTFKGMKNPRPLKALKVPKSLTPWTLNSNRF